MIRRRLRPSRLDLRPRGLTGLLLLGVWVMLLVAAPATLADVFTPESDSGSPNAEDIDTLYKFVFGLGVLVFLGVEGMLIYTLLKYRMKRHSPAPAQIRGNTRLEIGWTAGAAGLLVIIAAVMFVMLGDIKNPQNSTPGGLPLGSAGTQFAATGQPDPPSGKSLQIDVNGQQYLWRFDYPSDEPLFSYYEMVVPLDTTVTLNITSQDVQHSWWIPDLGGKMDAVPGHTNETWFRIPSTGDGKAREFVGECAELCGEGHADHYARVRALPPDEYEAWAARQTQAINESQEQLAASRREREATEPTNTETGGGEGS